MKRIYFFATPKDAAELLRKYDEIEPLKYVECGQFENPNPPIYLEGRQIPNLGISSTSTGSQSTSYLVSSQSTKSNIERFMDSLGNTRWMVHNGNNEDSVILTTSGIWNNSILLAGNMSTLHETSQAQQLMRRFQSVLKKSDFIKIDMWWVGSEALERLRSGWRLATAAAESPPEYNLLLPEELR
jgi:hypothetical protein